MTDARTAPPIIRIAGATKRFGSITGVEAVDLEIAEGEFFALLGPSGCGKTTLLRMIAGLEMPSEGTIHIAGDDMSLVPANRRPVNMVFQSYAVFPHMSVLDNVGYGLKVTGTPRDEIHRRAGEALALVKLDGFETRMPDQLSGGQRQRVALARALVKRPKVLLLDEPLSALDAKLREQMQLELVNLQHTVGITFVVVTHDQEEALSMADRIAVMDRGRVQQVATPAELYEFPASRFVADFIGSVNLFEGTVEASGAGAITVRGDQVTRPIRVAQPRPAAAGSRVWVALRPEKVDIARLDSAPMPEANALDGVVEAVTYQGDLSIYHVRTAAGDGGMVKVAELNLNRATARPFSRGDEVMLSWTDSCGVVLQS